MKKIIVIPLLFLSFLLNGAVIRGIITESNGTPLPFANVYVKNSTYGVTADNNGAYFMELKAGTYTLVYNLLGYKTLEKEITIKNKDELVLDIVLEKSEVQINQIEIVANKVDKAKKIMKKVRQNRKEYYQAVDNFKCVSYVKTSIESELRQKSKDTISGEKDFNTFLKKEKLNLIEYIANTYYKRPGKFKEDVTAYHDYADVTPIDFDGSISVGNEKYGESELGGGSYYYNNPNIFYQNITSADFNFYKNKILLATLYNQPFISPIAGNSALVYNYKFVTSFYENGTKINKISVEPKNKVSSTFYGHIFIEDSTWALLSVDLYVNEQVLSTYKKFNIIQNYEKIEDGIYLPSRTEIIYTVINNEQNIVIGGGKKKSKQFILGNTKIMRTDYAVNQPNIKSHLNNEIISYTVDAMDKDSVFWAESRPVELREHELEFISQADSIKNYYLSDTYLDKQDSIFNRITWWTPFSGWGHKNHYKGTTVYVGGLLAQMNIIGIGGYRHQLPVDFRKRFSNDVLLETNFFIDYGFQNKDVKGKVGVGVTYFPKKFVRTYILVGDYYSIINNYAAFGQFLSRSNYARAKTFEIRQRMEVVNGLYAELSFLYSKQLPIKDLQFSEWSELLFGKFNNPLSFETYIKSEMQLELRYVPAQKYFIKNNRKIIIGSDLPEIFLKYRKGIPKIFKSEVNFDYLEIGSKGIFLLGRMGESRWHLRAGSFLNHKNLRVLEYKYFRGSDAYLFSNPITSLQLLPLVFYTNREYLQFNYIHHFGGFILNRVPLLKYIKLSIAAGTSSLLIPDKNFYQIETFAGLEKPFRIRTQKFRVGLYAVTADNNLSKANFSVKVGITYFDSYKRKWGY